MMKNKIIFSIAALLGTSMTANSADHLGDLNLDSHFYEEKDDAGNVIATVHSRNFTLPAYSGDNVVFYHDETQVNLSRGDIDTLVDRLDVAVDLYRAYGDPQYPDIDNVGSNDDQFLNTASATLLSHVAGPAGLGRNGKGEVFKTASKAQFFDNWPTDARTWEVAYYEMGRGSGFSIYPYFHISGQMDPMAKAFPRLVTWSTLEEVGIDHVQSSTDPIWGAADMNVSPVRFENELQSILWDPANNTSFDFADFFNSTTAPKGVITANGVSVDLVDAYAVVLNDLREQYGHDYMVEFFNFARKNADDMTPSNAQEALCNISVAANVALAKISGTGINQNVVGAYLENEYNFPACDSGDVDIQLNEQVTHIITGRENVISWDAWGDAPANASIQVFIINKEGAPWRHFASFDMGVTEFNYDVPSVGPFGKMPYLEVFVGVESGGAWIASHSKEYTPTNSPVVTINPGAGMLRHVGKAYLSWEANFELAGEGFRLWGDYDLDSAGWVHLGSTGNKERSIYVDVNDTSTMVDTFLGATSNGRFIADHVLPFPIIE